MRKRGNGEGTIGKTSRGLFVARITIGVTEDGKPRRKAVTAQTRKEVAQKLAELIRERDAGTLALSGDITLGQLMERWLEDVVRPYRAPSTYRTHRNYAGNHVYPALGMVKVKTLSIHKLQTFFNEKKAAGIHPNTVLHLKHLVSGALTQGVKWGILERNVARSVEVAKVPKFKGTTLSWSGGKKLLDVCGEDPVYGPLMFLAMLTAMRQGELLGLTWDKVDFAAETIRVEQTLQRVNRQWHIGDVKTESSKATISVDSRTTEMLVQHRAWQASIPMTEWTQLGLVFTNEKGMPLHSAAVGRKIHGFLDAAGLPRVRFHDLRHGHASMMFDNKESVLQVKEALRHSNSSVTISTYGHLMEDRQHQAVRRLSDRLFAEDAP